MHGLLTGHTGATAQGWKTAERWPEREDARTSGRDAKRASDIAADAPGAAPEHDEGGLAAGAPAAGELAVARVHGAAEGVVDGLGDHHGGRDVGLDVEDGAGPAQEVREHRLVRRRVADVRREAHGRVEPDQVEVVLQRDGQPVEGSERLARLREVRV